MLCLPREGAAEIGQAFSCCADAAQDATTAPLWGQLLTAQLQLLAADRPANGGDESAEEPEESVGEPTTRGRV